MLDLLARDSRLRAGAPWIRSSPLTGTVAPLLIALVALPACARIWGFADLRGSNDGSSAAIDGRAADLANITVPGVGGAAASRRGGTGGSGSTDNRDARSDGADVG